MRDAAEVSAATAARELGLSIATVQRDVRRGCAGIVRPGEPGRGRGALLDLEAYRAWRLGEQSHDRVVQLAGETALRVYREYGGATATLRRHAALLLAIYVEQYCAALSGSADLSAQINAKIRTLLNVFVESGSPPREGST